MFSSLIVSITKKIYNTDDKSMFFRVSEIMSLMVIILVADIAGFILIAINGNTASLPVCIGALVMVAAITGFIAYKGSKIPPEHRGKPKK